MKSWEEMSPKELLQDLEVRAEKIREYSFIMNSVIPDDKKTWMAHDDPSSNIMCLSHHVVNIGRELNRRSVGQGEFIF